jgi:hypothetical protein
MRGKGCLLITLKHLADNTNELDFS